MSDGPLATWTGCECKHLDVSHASDGPCALCICLAFKEQEK